MNPKVYFITGGCGFIGSNFVRYLLEKKDVKILAQTKCWLKYKIPKKYLRQSAPLCIGQKQKWFMLKFLSHNGCIRLDKSKNPEFDRWRWVNFWDPINEVIYFKKKVYNC